MFLRVVGVKVGVVCVKTPVEKPSKLAKVVGVMASPFAMEDKISATVSRESDCGESDDIVVVAVVVWEYMVGDGGQISRI